MARLHGDSLFFVHVSSGFVDVSSLADLPGDPDLGTSRAIGSVE